MPINNDFYWINAFADNPFSGNPAGVCMLDFWRSDEQLQQVAQQNNLAETAFLIPYEGEEDYHLRWLTPAVEVDLCGHATLASGFVVLNHYLKDKKTVSFHTRSGRLEVFKKDELYYLNFPSYPPFEVSFVEELIDVLKIKPLHFLQSEKEKEERRYICIYEDEKFIQNFICDTEKLKSIGNLSICITAPSQQHGVDFVSRYFAPHHGLPEDQVTGSNHSLLIPYWSKIMNKNKFIARQLSQRGGVLNCELQNDRVYIGGNCHQYISGKLTA